MSNVIFV